MTTLTTRAAATYARLELETSVGAASPQRLIVMLYDGVLRALGAGRAALLRKDAAARGAALSKAIAIIDEGLRPALDLEAGGEIAQNLEALYVYITHRLLQANLKAEIEPLEEAARLLGELKEAWDVVLAEPAVPVEVAHPEPRGAMSYGRA